MRLYGYQQTPKGWAVGTYDPQGKFITDTDELTYDAAVNLANDRNDKIARGILEAPTTPEVAALTKRVAELESQLKTLIG